MNIDDLTIGQAKQINSILAGQTNTQSQEKIFNGEHAIVVLQFGWVFVGELYTVDGAIELRNGKNIRRWGTDKGIMQLKNGPLENTKLDPHADISINPQALIMWILTEKAKWQA